MPRTLVSALAVTLAAALTLALPPAAHAAGPNGGQTVSAQGHPIEFVASDSAITFFVTHEDGEPQDTAKASGKAYLSAGGRTETLVLAPAAPNRLVGALSAPLAAGTKVVLAARLHGHSLQARFEK